MKKCTFSFLLFICFVLFLMPIMSLAAEENVTGNGEIGVGGEGGERVVNNFEPVGWKVSVYLGKEGATKHSPVNSTYFSTPQIAVLYNSKTKNGFSYYSSSAITMGVGNKFKIVEDYNKGKGRTETTKASSFTLIDVTSDSSFPTGLRVENTNLSVYSPKIKKYFAENAYEKIVRRINSEIGIDDMWFVSFEPIFHAWDPDRGRRLFFTPSEYALDQGQGFDSLSEKRVYPCMVTIKGAGLAMPDDKTWFGLANNSDEAYFSTISHEQFRDNWSKVKDSVIRFGGVGYAFSKGFELPDYTVEAAAPSVAWENETIEIGSTVHNSNPARGGSVNVTMTYLDANGQALQSQTKNVTMAGKTTEYVSWQINAGTYSQTGADNARSVRITVTPVGDPNKRLEINGDNNSAGGQLKLMRNFSVSDVCINDSTSPVRIKENTTVTATFTVTNHNPFRAYENIYIGVYLKKSNGAAVSLGGQSVTLAAGAKKHGKMRINVGSVTANCDQVFTVIATVNLQGVSASRGRVWVYEFEQRGGTTHTLEDNRNRRSNKGFTEGNIIVTRKMSMGMKIFAGTYSNRNASVTTDKRTTGMVTCVLENSGNYNMYETNASKDRLYAQISYNGKTQKSPVVCVPAKGTNITWFKVEIPNASNIVFSGKMIWNYQTVYVDAEGETHTREKEEIFNAESVNSTINTITIHKTPDTVLDKDAAERTNTSASGYSKASGYVLNHTERPRVAQWEQWKMSGSTFVLHRYALAGEVTKAQLTPANMGNEKEYVNIKGQIASGSAFSLDFSYGVKKQSSMGDPIKDSDYTLVQNAIALFPEFGYKRGETASRTLFFSGNNLGAPMYFDLNRSADGEQNGAHTGQRVHFTPLNMPDGTYKVAVEGYDLWTPAGMIYVIATPSLTVHGSIYDYNYMS